MMLEKITLVSLKFFYALLFALLSLSMFSQEITFEWLQDNYRRKDVSIPMRDGTGLYTVIYIPVHGADRKPLLMTRTPYGCHPYDGGFPESLVTYMAEYVRAGYTIVFQDVRGRYMSQGAYENIRPLCSSCGKESEKCIDEATDSYDTVEWLLDNLSFNGNVGVTGVSYPGFYATMAALSGHPAVKAVSPQAPILDWFLGDDCHHNGVFMLLDTYFFGGSFYRECHNPITKIPSVKWNVHEPVYDFFLERKTISKVRASLNDSLDFWNRIVEHPDYDEFWRQRSLIPHLKNVKPAVLVVGGSFDSDDCFGAVNTYAVLKKKSPKTQLHFVYGPWYHGGWHDMSYSSLGDIFFGNGISKYFLSEIEYPFFRYYLENEGAKPSEVYVYPSGSRGWLVLDSWPEEDTSFEKYYLHKDGGLSKERPDDRMSYSSYVSDPSDPVPYYGSGNTRRDKKYMVADQSFIFSRSDVLSFSTEEMTDTLRLCGPVRVQLEFSSSTEDLDLVVKLIDVFPDGYQMLVRGDIFRARYRKSMTRPCPLVPGKKTGLDFTLPDVAHYILPGHKMMVQIQSSWFPLADMNPQKYVENIYRAEESDFVESEVRIYHQRNAPSAVVLPVVHESRRISDKSL